MELKLCSKEIAIQLKELGFDWLKDANEYYIDDNGVEVWYSAFQNMKHIHKNKLYNKPTQALVCKWFRIVHNIEIYTRVDKRTNKYYGYVQEIVKEHGSQIEIPLYSTYEQTEEAGILKAIEILKQNKNEHK